MSRAAYPSRVAIAHALACLGGKAAEVSNYRGPLAKVHELLSETPPKVESAAVAAAAGLKVTCPIQAEAPAERQPEAWLLAAVHELLADAGTRGAATEAPALPAAPDAHIVDGEPRRLATACVTGAGAKPAEPRSRPQCEEPPLFFDLRGRYVIAPDTTLCDLLDDFECLFNSGMGSLESEALDCFSDAQWAGVYLLRQAGAVGLEIVRRAKGDERIGGEAGGSDDDAPAWDATSRRAAP